MTDARILVVDDDRGARLLARKSLERAGFIVNEAEDGVQAVAIFQQARPQLILMDVEMPNLDGFGACQQLRVLGTDVPILMATGLDDITSINRAYEVGATDFATKPINWSILAHRVRYMLRANATLKALKESEARLANAQRIARLGTWDWDIRNNHLRGSKQTYQILGIEPEAFQPTWEGFLAYVHPDDMDNVVQVVDRALREGKSFNTEYRIIRADGIPCVVHGQNEVTVEAGQVITVTGTLQDITERRAAEERIRHLAYYDSLTGLPNREYFKEHLERALDRCARNEGLVVILFLDLDDFKRINDSLGHTVGDMLLEEVADRLLRSVRASDYIARGEAVKEESSVARLGGDEFTVLLEVSRVEDAAIVAQRILDSLIESVTLAGYEVFVTTSIGISIYPYDGKDLDTLLKNADTAMYAAKQAGKSTYKFYSIAMSSWGAKRLSLESKLRKALEKDELLLYYQPQLQVASGQVVGMEALLRWRNPELGLVSPGDFIPLAEDTGMIISIGEWVLHTACAQHKVWQDAGYHGMRVAVNLSAMQFRQSGLAQVIDAALKQSDLAPEFLELELTESIIMHSARESIATLHELKAMGLTLSVDDFGTGYSSLSYLKQFPLDSLKIDRSFIEDLVNQPDDAAITTAIIAMAHSLNLQVVAEGVTSEQQLDFLRHLNCEMVQGFLFSKPLPAEEFMRYLQQASERSQLPPEAPHGG